MVRIEATGEGESIATANPFFEDVKAFYSLRAADQSAESTLNLVNLSSQQLEQSGTVPVRIPR
jgi:hypothetical protein